MKLLNNLKRIWKDEGFTRIRRYIRHPAWIAFSVTGGIVWALILWMLLFGKLENLIVSFDIRYNSLIFMVLIGGCLGVMALATLYGIYLSIQTYKRPGRKGIFRRTYEDGTSYKALQQYLNGGKEEL